MTLTIFQQKLIDGLIKEFETLNPKVTLTNGVKKFGANTINEVLNEEVRLKATMEKHNATMSKTFIRQFDDDFKDLKKEFGKIFDFQIGYRGDCHTKDGWTKEHSLSHTVELFIVSRIKSYTDTMNVCNDKAYAKIYVKFKLERVTERLDAGKEVTLNKIVGLQYSLTDSYNTEEEERFSTLDGLVQSSKELQSRLVYLSK